MIHLYQYLLRVNFPLVCENYEQPKNNSNNDSDKKSDVKHKYLVEIVGTFILVYAIASAATVYSDSGQIGVIGIGLVHALVLTAINIRYWLSIWCSSQSRRNSRSVSCRKDRR